MYAIYKQMRTLCVLQYLREENQKLCLLFGGWMVISNHPKIPDL